MYMYIVIPTEDIEVWMVQVPLFYIRIDVQDLSLQVGF